ncbi:uncharacterized protein EHS24_002447 [Apiotrichum porosum]|uniref:Uncharacterized protein n=1 Tax=Apiotrichum porosum TaxID=105984 RepID=A0A427XGQ0_9TREE|nr:uncharacterized protein EHS24_002447 [Apiotrichum porosum]RSH77996.1 hypothetical protein EHS24_002447 [Apiotrichum porosum]
MTADTLIPDYAVVPISTNILSQEVLTEAWEAYGEWNGCLVVGNMSAVRACESMGATVMTKDAIISLPLQTTAGTANATDELLWLCRVTPSLKFYVDNLIAGIQSYEGAENAIQSCRYSTYFYIGKVIGQEHMEIPAEPYMKRSAAVPGIRLGKWVLPLVATIAALAAL